MALQFSVPVMIKLGEGMCVSLSMVTRYFVMENVVYPTLKKEVQDLMDAKTLERALEKADYEYVNKSDAISFFFVGSERVDYRVGLEITQEDYDRVVIQLAELQLRTKDDGKPSDNKVKECPA